MAKIVAKTRYRNDPHGLNFNAGDTFEADETLATFLFGDSPESFELWKPEPVVDKPPVDKAIKRSRTVKK
jgi:hypothetical protein